MDGNLLTLKFNRYIAVMAYALPRLIDVSELGVFVGWRGSSDRVRGCETDRQSCSELAMASKTYKSILNVS